MSIRIEYREGQTGDLYVLRYDPGRTSWRIFAELHPENPFDEAVTKCHLFPSGELCVDRSRFNPNTLEKAKAVAYFWMEAYSQYVRTGVFPATGGVVNV